MEKRHRSHVLDTLGVNCDKVHLLRKYDKSSEDDEILDPFGGNAEDYEKVFGICKRACEGFLDSVY